MKEHVQDNFAFTGKYWKQEMQRKRARNLLQMDSRRQIGMVNYQKYSKNNKRQEYVQNNYYLRSK